MRIKIAIPSKSIEETCLIAMMKHCGIKHELSGDFYLIRSTFNNSENFEQFTDYLNRNKIEWLQK